MLKYSIKLKTVEDFRQFANLTVKFPVRGYVELDGEYTDMYCLLDIISRCPIKKMDLILTKYDETDAEEIGRYLSVSGLLSGEHRLEKTYDKIA